MGSFEKTIPYSKRVLQETKNEQESHCFVVFVALQRNKGTFGRETRIPAYPVKCVSSCDITHA